MTNAIDKPAVLRQTGLFGSLSSELINKIAGLAVTRHFPRGRVLYSESEEASGLYIVAQGELRSIRQSAEGREQVLSIERPGAILAVVPVVNGGKYYSTMIADTNSVVLCIKGSDVHVLCREHPEVAWNLATVLAHRVRHYAGLIEALALRNVDQRVAQYLLAVAQRRGVPVEGGCIIELTLTRAEIATRIGSVREVVSRALVHLENSGLIQTKGRRLITIPNMEALRAFAGLRRHVETSGVLDLSSELA